MAEEEGKKKKGGMIKWIILVVVLLLLAGGGWFAYTKFFAAPDDAAAAEKQAQEQSEGMAPKDGDTQLVQLSPFLVNLADPLGRRYIQLKLHVEVPNEDVAGEITSKEPKIRDTINLLLSSKTYNDLAMLESKLMLKDEIVKRLNLVLGGQKVLNVYYDEIVVQ